MITPKAEVKVMANYKKFWGIFIAVAVTCFVLLILLMEFGKPSVSYYNSIQECINSKIEEIKKDSDFDNPEATLSYKSKIISYENESQYCEFYSSPDGTVYFIVIDKVNTENGTQYSCKNLTTFIFYSDDVRNFEGYEFQCADKPEEIEIEGAELNEITFTINGKSFKRILAFKDCTSNPSGD